MNLHRLTYVVDQSLLIAKAEQGRLILKPEIIDLSKILSDVAKDFDLLATENARALLLEITANCWIEADSKYLKQILHSLLTNTLKHGQGDIYIKLVRKKERGALLIYNQKLREAPDQLFALGLGMRVVSALIHLHPHLLLKSRRGEEYYLTRITFPLAHPLEAIEQPEKGMVALPGG